MKSSRTKVGAALAASTAIALLATGCSAGGNSGGSGDEIELTVTTFGTFGYDDLYAEYEEANPGIKISATNIDTGGNARTDVFTKLGSGGLSDVVAIEEGWLGAIMTASDAFSDLRDYGIEDRKSDWLDWKYEQATDPSGRVIGYGTDVGPEGLCYNKVLFEAAGLPTDRAEVAELFGGADATWQDYFDLGKQYNQSTGKPWYDQSSFVWNAMVNQLDEGYYTADGELNVEGNAELQERWGWLADGAAAGLPAGSPRWDWNGGKDFTNGQFATFMCPGWMLGNIKNGLESAGGDASTGWDMADVFPGGPANWGGAFLTVPVESEHPEEAAALADWLTQPEQQIKQFEAAGTFPSTVEAQEQLAADATPNELFGGAPVGAILASRAKGVVAQFKGPEDSVIQENVFQVAADSLDSGERDGPAAWDHAISLLDQLVK